MKSNKKILRVLVLVFIVVAIASVWLIKTQQKKSAAENIGSGDAIPLEISSVDLEDIKSHGLPILLDFGSDSCIPCKEMAPVLVKINEEMQGKAVIHFTDVWKYPENSQDFPIQVIPTQVLIDADGTPYVPSDNIINSIPGFQMYSVQDTNEHVFTVHQGGLTEEQMRSILEDMGVAQ